MNNTTQETIKGYYDGIKQKSGWEAFMSDDIAFDGTGVKATKGKEAFVEGNNQFLRAVTTSQVKEMIVEMATVEFQASERHANPMGTLHGGVLCDVADAAMGMAYASTLAAGESFTTLELKINFLKPIWRAKLQAIGRVVKKGRTVGLVECDVLDEQQQLVARTTSTCMTLHDEQARGR